MVEVSVVVPTREPDGELAVRRHLEAGPCEDYEVVVGDDPSVTVARNRAVERADADKLVFLDDDSRPREGYLSRAASVLDRERAVAGRTVHPGDGAVARLASHYDFGDEPRYVTRFWGCNMALRRDVLETVGGWNERLGWGHEEKELAERVLRECPIYYDPELVVEHEYAASLPDYWRKQYAMETQTPRYWATRDVPRREQWLRIVRTALDPSNYLGRSPAHALARIGGTAAVTAGRLVGMWRTASGGDSDDPSCGATARAPPDRRQSPARRQSPDRRQSPETNAPTPPAGTAPASAGSAGEIDGVRTDRTTGSRGE